jgi:regulatory Fis family protein
LYWNIALAEIAAADEVTVYSPDPNERMSALSYLYDNMCELPAWFRRLTPGQVADIADLLTRWRLPNESHTILSKGELERREYLRAISICGGNLGKAAKALQIGKTTLYRKLKSWGYTAENRMAQAQAAALAGDRGQQEHCW